jgi:protein SCO1/2
MSVVVRISDFGLPIETGSTLVLAVTLFFSTATNLLAQTDATAASRNFAVRGIILKIEPGEDEVLIRNEAISNYMEAMTMPFPLKHPDAVNGLKRGDKVAFQLHVNQDNSWADHFSKIGTVSLDGEKAAVKTPPTTAANASLRHNPLLEYKFTNELGQAVSFNDFRGQALAVTFFYTRCPLPDFCPRLSRNFQEASQKLEAMTNGPANWHFISVSFDPEFDTPEMLRNYGKSYQYDPAHWSFFTGPPDKIAELARAAGVEYEESGGTINHNFRTMIVNAQGHLQMVFPTSGDLSDQIVSEILKATAAQPGSKMAGHQRLYSVSASPASETR